MNAETIVAVLLEMTPGESWWPINHPLNKPPGKFCPKCQSPRVALPAYNSDWFDCLDCGHAWPMTAKQQEFMRNNPASFYDKNGRLPADQIRRIRLGQRP